jgi:hypothetical protein
MTGTLICVLFGVAIGVAIRNIFGPIGEKYEYSSHVVNEDGDFVARKQPNPIIYWKNSNGPITWSEGITPPNEFIIDGITYKKVSKYHD